jgi:transketolase
VRNAFIQGLTEAAEADPRIVFLTADLGFKLFDDFARRFPGRFMNVGVAEANMVGVAAGLALEGMKPFVYSIVPFVTLRCYEQVRNDVCYHNANVTVVGVGGGYSYGQNGPTHHALEDIAAMRVLPNLSIVCPGDPAETIGAVHALAAHDGPAYLRLGRAGEPKVHASPVELTHGRAIQMRSGSQVIILTTGNMLATAMQTVDSLQKHDVSCGVISVPYVKPLDRAALAQAAQAATLLVTLEEHSVLGGFGSAILEALSSLGISRRVKCLGAPDRFSSDCGDQAYHREAIGLTPAAISAVILQTLEPR